MAGQNRLNRRALPDSSRYAIVHGHSLARNATFAKEPVIAGLYGRREFLILVDDMSLPAGTHKAE